MQYVLYVASQPDSSIMIHWRKLLLFNFVMFPIFNKLKVYTAFGLSVGSFVCESFPKKLSYGFEISEMDPSSKK